MMRAIQKVRFAPFLKITSDFQNRFGMKALIQIAKKLWVFLLINFRRDAQSLVSFGSKYLWIFILCFAYGSFFKTVLWQKEIHFKGHVIDFPLFFVSGLIVARIIPFSLRIVDDTLSQLRNSGLIEWVLIAPTSLWELFISKILWNGFTILTEIITIVVCARLWIGTPIRPFLQIAVIQPVFFMFVAYAGIGMIISSLSLFLRRNNFVFTAFFQISAIFGGVFFPTELFKGKLKILLYLSHSLPITYALKSVRLALIHEKNSNSFFHAPILAIMAFVFISMGFILLNAGIRWAKKNGKFSRELYN